MEINKKREELDFTSINIREFLSDREYATKILKKKESLKEVGYLQGFFRKFVINANERILKSKFNFSEEECSLYTTYMNYGLEDGFDYLNDDYHQDIVKRMIDDKVYPPQNMKGRFTHKGKVYVSWYTDEGLVYNEFDDYRISSIKKYPDYVKIEAGEKVYLHEGELEPLLAEIPRLGNEVKDGFEDYNGVKIPVDEVIIPKEYYQKIKLIRIIGEED